MYIIIKHRPVATRLLGLFCIFKFIRQQGELSYSFFFNDFNFSKVPLLFIKTGCFVWEVCHEWFEGFDGERCQIQGAGAELKGALYLPKIVFFFLFFFLFKYVLLSFGNEISYQNLVFRKQATRFSINRVGWKKGSYKVLISAFRVSL